MRYLVTGGCGFIGSHLVDELNAAGHTVAVLDNLSSGRRDYLPPGVELIVGCVTEPRGLARAMAEADGIFHLAAIASVARSNDDWLWTHRVNQTGTVAVLDAARLRGLPVVFASSAAVYGAQATMPLTESMVPEPLTAYGADKLGSELHGRVAATIHEVPTVGLRFFNVYGPRQLPNSPYSGVISIFAAGLHDGLPLTVHGNGSQTRDFVYVGDVVRALVLAMEMKQRNSVASAEIFNVCSGIATSIKDLAATLMMVAGRQVPLSFSPDRLGDVAASVGDPARASVQLKFEATTRLEAGLKRLFTHQ